MSEFNPFSAAAGEVEEAHAAPAVEEAGSSRKTAVALGLVTVLLAAGAYVWFTGDDEAEIEALGAPVAAPRAAASPAADAAAPKPAAKKLPAASSITLGRNPFRALYVQPPPPAPPKEEVPGTGAGTGFVPMPGSAPAPVGTAPGTGAGAPATAPGAPTGAAPQQPTAKEHKLVLLRVFGTGKDQSASFSIDGKQQTAKVGTTFGPSAEILLLSLQQGPKDDQWTAVLQVGDGDPFDVVTGEPAYVR